MHASRDLVPSHPSSAQAARFVTIGLRDLPSHFRTSRARDETASVTVSDTLAEYRCERAEPPAGATPVSAGSAVFSNLAGTLELHETTAVYATPAQAASRLALETNPRYPLCKRAELVRELRTVAPDDRVVAVDVHVTRLDADLGAGFVIDGTAALTLPGDVSDVETSDLVLLVRGRIVAELSIETDGPPPTSLETELARVLSERMAEMKLPDDG